MKKIHLYKLFSGYPRKFYLEVHENDYDEVLSSLSREIADVYFEFYRDEENYLCNQYRNDAYFSLDCDDGIENAILVRGADPAAEYEREVMRQRLHSEIAALPGKQPQRVYAHFVLKMSISAIATGEGVDESSVRESIKRALRNMKKNMDDESL